MTISKYAVNGYWSCVVKSVTTSNQKPWSNDDFTIHDQLPI